VGWRLLADCLDLGCFGDPDLVVVVLQEPVGQQLVGLVEQEALEVLEEVELAPCVDLEELEDPGECAGAMEKGEQRVGKAQSNCIGILEACPPPQ
jgi:hypothetical protein